MAERTVSVSLLAKVSGFVAGMRTAQKAAQDFTSKLQKGALDNQAHLNTLSANLGILGGSLAGAAALAVKSFADFDAAMSNVRAATHASAADMALLKDAALEAGARTAFSATEAAGAIENLAKAGVSTADILSGGLSGALDLAAAGQMDVAEAAEIAAVAMTQFGLSGADIPHIADVLAAAAGKAQGEVRDMGQALKYVGPIASQMGISIEETSGAIALLASNGIIGEQAGTALRGMLSSLTSPSQQAAEKLKELGINVYDASGNFVGFEGIAGQLQARMGGLDNATRDAALGVIFGNEQLTAARVLYKGGAQDINAWTRAVDDQGYAAETAAIKMDNLKGDVEEFLGALETAFIGAGEGADGPLRDLVQSATDVVNAFSDLPDEVQQGILSIVGGGGLVLLGVAGLTKLIGAIAETREALQGLGRAGKLAGTALKFTGAYGAITLVAQGLDELGDSLQGLNTDAQHLAASFRDWQDEGKLSGDLAKIVGDDFERLGKLARLAIDPSFKERMDDAAASLVFADSALDKANKSFDLLDQTLASMDPKEAAQGFREIREALQEQGLSVEQINGLFPLYRDAVRQAKRENQEAAKAQRDNAEAASEQAPAVETAADALKKMDERASQLNDTLEILNGTMGNLDAESAYEQAIDDLSTRLSEYREESKNGENGTKDLANAFDLSEQAGRDNYDALSNLWRRTGEYAEQIYRTTGNQQRANEVLRAGREQLVRTAEQFLGSRQAAERYVTEVLGIPKDVSTQYRAPGLAANAATARGYKSTADALDGREVTTTFTTRRIEILQRNEVFGQGPGFASGGLVTGPGGPRDDLIPAMLSNGEFVVNAAATARHLDLLNRINRGFAPEPHAGGFGAVKSGRRPVPTAQAYTPSRAVTADAGGGDTFNFYPRSVDINERTFSQVTYAARLRRRVGRPR